MLEHLPKGEAHCPESRQAPQRRSGSAVPNSPVFLPVSPHTQAVCYCCCPAEKCVPCRTLLQGSLEHQVFRLLSRLCWGDRQESVANETVHCSLCWCHLAIYCPPRTLRRNFCGTIRRWANAGTERRKHTDRGFCLPCTRSFHRCAENRIIRWSALTHPAFM